MTTTEKLKSLLQERYISEDEEEYKIELIAGLNDQQIENLCKNLPLQKIPIEINELLMFSSGFEFYGFEEITFESVEI